MAKGDEGIGIRDDDSATQRSPHPSLGESRVHSPTVMRGIQNAIDSMKGIQMKIQPSATSASAEVLFHASCPPIRHTSPTSPLNLFIVS